MVLLDDIRQIIGEVLQLGDRVDSFDSDTQLLGSLPEFDSMAVVTVITAVEESFDIMVDDDEVSAEVFETLGSLFDYVSTKVAG